MQQIEEFSPAARLKNPRYKYDALLDKRKYRLLKGDDYTNASSCESYVRALAAANKLRVHFYQIDDNTIEVQMYDPRPLCVV